MNKYLSKQLTVFAILASAWPLAAQTTAPARPTIDEEKEVVVLSPFEVSTSSNIGYQATDTLGGTRIRTDLRDVGSAISVATKEFMRDIGATDNQSLLQFMPSTEVGGTGGNFGGLGDGATLNDNAARLAPNNTTRVRGLDSADNTRDFFLTDIPWDGYNVSRVDIQRGANSILFGNGSGAGIINSATDDATIGLNRAVVTARYGIYGSIRGSLNFNYSFNGELAVHGALLDDKKYYRQDPAYNHDKREYVALRWEPKFLQKHGMRTSIKAKYETGSVDANRPRTSTPVDEISPWFRTTAENMVSPTAVNAAGTTLLGVISPMRSHAGYDPFVTSINSAAVIAANPTRQDVGARAAGTANYEPWISFGANNGINGDIQGGLIAVFPNANSGTMSNFLNPGTGTVVLYGGLNSAGARDGSIGGLRLAQLDGILSFKDYTSAAVGAPYNGTATTGFLGQASGIYRTKSLSDPSIFDFYNNLIDGPNKREFSNFHAFNISLDQTFFNDKAGFQFAYDKQSYTVGQNNQLGGAPIITIDIFKYLPAATVDAGGLLQPIANPNFGRPYTASGQGTYSRNRTEREIWRVTPFVDLNFKDILKRDNLFTKILGRHQFTGLFESNTVKTNGVNGPVNALTRAQALNLVGGTGGTIGGPGNKISVLTYLGPSLATGSLAGANLSNITAEQTPSSGPAIVFNSSVYLPTAPSPGAVYLIPALGLSPSATGGAATTQSENPANYSGWSSTTPFTVNNVNLNGLLATGATERRDETHSYAVVDQWQSFDHHLVITAGARKDTIRSFVPGTNGSGNRVLDSYGVVDYSQPFAYPDVATSSFTSEILKTYSIMLHTPEFIDKHLPWGLHGSVFYSKSDNFRPANRIDINGAVLAPPHGTTKDYGILVGALNGRVSLKVTRYDTQVFGADLGDSTSNNTRTRIGDEIRNAILYGYGVQNHSSGLGYRQTNPFDPTGLYAVSPTLHVDGSLVTPASPATQADWVKTEQNIQASATAALANSLDKTAILATYGIVPSTVLTQLAANPNAAPVLNQSYKSGLTITGDTVSKGTEYELFLRPTKDWNITLNASKTFASRVNLASAVSDWLETRWALYSGTSAPPLQGIGDLPWFGQGGTDNASRVNTTGLARFSRNAWQFYQQFRAQEGNAVPELRPWRFNVVNNYTFSHGALKGVFVGASYRWEDRNVIGYGYTETTPRVSISSPDLGKLDVNKPFYGPTESHVGAWAGYTKKFSKFDWRIQVNINNVAESAHLVPVNTNPDGSIGSWRIADGQGWEITNTFTF